jgi:hypothetical protein
LKNKNIELKNLAMDFEERTLEKGRQYNLQISYLEDKIKDLELNIEKYHSIEQDSRSQIYKLFVKIDEMRFNHKR